MIDGVRLSLRPFRPDDLPHLRRWHADGAVMRWWGERLPVPPGAELEAALAPGGRFTRFEPSGAFCVEICGDPARPIGLIQYEGSAPRDRRAQLGLLIGEPDAWGQGYGPEATVLLLNWLINHRNLHRVWLTVQANNRRAIRAYEKVGFRREGTFREHNFYDGRFNDELIFGILAPEFNARYRPDRSDWLVPGALLHRRSSTEHSPPPRRRPAAPTGKGQRRQASPLVWATIRVRSGPVRSEPRVRFAVGHRCRRPSPRRSAMAFASAPSPRAPDRTPRSRAWARGRG